MFFNYQDQIGNQSNIIQNLSSIITRVIAFNLQVKIWYNDDLGQVTFVKAQTTSQFKSDDWLDFTIKMSIYLFERLIFTIILFPILFFGTQYQKEYMDGKVECLKHIQKDVMTNVIFWINC